MIVQQSAAERKEVHQRIVEAAKDDGDVKLLSSSQKTNNRLRSVTTSRNPVTINKALKNQG